MDELDDMFRDLEMNLSGQFTNARAREVWGDDITISDPDKTIKGSDSLTRHDASAESITTVAVSTGPQTGNLSAAADVSVMLSIHTDGSASMTIPGASVTLTPRRASVSPGGEYEIGEILGMGGMGIVNRARQASLDREIVVKTIRPEYAERIEAQEKFITEALATGSLDHPNVVPVHDMGVSEGGNPFYVMKEVKGQNWREMLPTLSETENVDILFRVCDAVAFAHDRGIIHRDLKPENVMLGDFGEVLVMDWGLAAAIQPTAKAAQLSHVNACAGTPSFMAPEMARGLAQEIGPWSDQYLLGAILFNVLTGKPPHPGKTAQDGVRNAANNVIIETDRDDEWMRVAKRAMETEPHKRYTSVKAFQEALGNCRVHHDSIVLTNQADSLLEKARAGSAHEEFPRAIHAYEQALVLWRENSRAKSALRDARYDYAAESMAHGDYGVAISLLENDFGEREQKLVADARDQVLQRHNRRRLVRVLGWLAASLLLLVALVSGVAYVLISRQAEAERVARAEAENQRHIAERRRSEADQHRRSAEEQRSLAEEQRNLAESNHMRAVSALRTAQVAREAEALAQEQRLAEQEAKLEAEERARQRAEEALRAQEEIQRLGYLEDNSRWKFDAGTARERRQAAAMETGLPVEKKVQASGTTIEMGLIPAGVFVMGSPPRDPTRNNDEYLHEVELSRPFHLSRTEVTRAQWRAVVGVEKLGDLGIELGDDAARNVLWRVRPLPDGERTLPATGVSYRDVLDIFLPALQRVGGDGYFRLPSEAEWEWAVRAGSTGHFYPGDRESDLADCGWYDGNSAGRVQEVGGREPNAWGMNDMIGNVWEMVFDSYDALYYLRAPRTDPVNDSPDIEVKVSRGGSYINSARLCRMSYRGTYMHERNRYPHVGFRVAWSEWDWDEREVE